jgi:hypothetical protein
MNNINNYIKHNNIIINDGSNNQETVKNNNICLINCSNDPNCQGVNIIQDNDKNTINDGYNYKSKPIIKCEYVNNISYSNSIEKNNNSNFYAKKNNIIYENNTPYLLKINNQCITLNNPSKIITTSCDNLTPVFLKNDSIKDNNNNCLTVNNNILENNKCNSYNNKQKFAFDNIYKTIRPINDLDMCITKNSNNDEFIISNCDIKNNILTFENFYKSFTPNTNDFIEHFEHNKSFNLNYYIIYLLLLLIIYYLIIIISSKKYN